VYDLQAYAGKSGKPVFPQLSEHSPLAKFLADQLTDQQLPPVGEYEKPPTINHLEPGEGIVEWYNDRFGSGRIDTQKDGAGVQARVHWSNIDTRCRFASLAKGPGRVKGRRVVYKEIDKPFQTTERRTSFQWEVFGVRLQK
jgi:cold shock CspA family protein